jgi:hypothetical protein
MAVNLYKKYYLQPRDNFWKWLIFSLALQFTALNLVHTGKYSYAGIIIYFIVLMAFINVSLLNDKLTGVILLLSSYGTSIVFRDNLLLIKFYFYTISYIIFFIVLLFKGRNDRNKFSKVIPVGICFLLYFMTSFWGRFFPYTLSVRLIGAFSSFALIYFVIEKVDDLKKFYLAIFFSTVVWFPFILNWQVDGYRFGILNIGHRGIYGNPITYAGSIGIWPIVGLSLVINKNVKNQLLYILSIVILFSIITITSSRTLIICNLISLIFLFITSIRKLKLVSVILVPIIIILSYYSLKYKPESNLYIMKTFDRKIEQQDRYVIFKKSIDIFNKNRLIGVGFGKSDIRLNKIDNLVLHTFWGKLLAESGLFGTVPMIFILFYQFIKLINKKNNSLYNLGVSAFFGMVAYGFFAHGLDLVMWAIYGISLSCSEIVEKC